MREGELLVPLVESFGGACEGSHRWGRRGTAVGAERLWLSRQVVARAAIREANREELDGFCRRRRSRPSASFARVSESPLTPRPVSPPCPTARLNDGALREWTIDAISSDPELAGDDRRRRRRACAERVLRSVTDALPAGERTLVLVDVGWGATIQGMLQRLLNDADAGVSVRGLYIAHKRQRHRARPRWHPVEGFLAQLNEPSYVVDTISRSPEVLEQVCMPDHGTQVAIDADGDPVLATNPASRQQGAERAAAQRGILAFPARVGPLRRCGGGGSRRSPTGRRRDCWRSPRAPSRRRRSRRRRRSGAGCTRTTSALRTPRRSLARRSRRCSRMQTPRCCTR